MKQCAILNKYLKGTGGHILTQVSANRIQVKKLAPQSGAHRKTDALPLGQRDMYFNLDSILFLGLVCSLNG